MELSERKKQILKAVVEDYVATAEPVGSKAIAAEMGVSSATVRNELAELVELGYLEQPHTSAGRVPSPKGYRLYVNELMEQQRLSLAETEKINDALRLKMEELDRLLSQAGQAVSRFVNYPAYVVAAGKSDLSVQRFELLRMEPQSLISVLMLSDQRVRSQLLHLQLPVEAEQLPPVTKLLNESFTGVSGKEMNLRLMALSDAVPPALFLLLNQIVSYGAEQLEELGQKTFVTAGARELLKLPEFRDADKAHELMSFLSDSTEKLPVPDDGSPMKILIGPENVSDALHDTSVVVASYDIGDNMRGLIGVVGPTRMDYAAVAARLSGFAEGLTRMFGKNGLPPKEEQ